jgi:ATP-binding cassette subfamily F protein 3
MLSIHHLTKHYNLQTILDDVTFTINPGEKVGLVGPNGAGKTTLFRILVGLEEADNGTVIFNPPEGSPQADLMLSYLPQGLEPIQSQDIETYLSTARPELAQVRCQLEALTERIEQEHGDDSLLMEYGDVLTRFELLGGYTIENEMQAILAGLGLAHFALDTPISVLNGGATTRLSLARLLLSKPALMLLDEPTNYLDIEALDWLETFIHTFDGAVLVISHDRMFLNHTVQRILELDPATHKLRSFEGNYDDYEAVKLQERDKHWAVYHDQVAEERRLKQDMVQTMERARKFDNMSKNDFYRRKAKIMARKAQAKGTRLEKYLEREERVERPDKIETIRLDYGQELHSGQKVCELVNVGMKFERWLFRGFSDVIAYGEKICLVGPNGSGKTSLLRILLGQLEPTEGTAKLGVGVKVGYIPQQDVAFEEASLRSLTPFDIARSVSDIKENEIYHLYHKFLIEGDDVRKAVHLLSYGQRARIALARTILTGANFLILDEPINHLDIPSRDAFYHALTQYAGTVLLVAHDRDFVQRFPDRIWKMTGEKVIRDASLGE